MEENRRLISIRSSWSLRFPGRNEDTSSGMSLTPGVSAEALMKMISGGQARAPDGLVALCNQLIGLGWGLLPIPEYSRSLLHQSHDSVPAQVFAAPLGSDGSPPPENNDLRTKELIKHNLPPRASFIDPRCSITPPRRHGNPCR